LNHIMVLLDEELLFEQNKILLKHLIVLSLSIQRKFQLPLLFKRLR